MVHRRGRGQLGPGQQNPAGTDELGRTLRPFAASSTYVDRAVMVAYVETKLTVKVAQAGAPKWSKQLTRTPAAEVQ